MSSHPKNHLLGLTPPERDAQNRRVKLAVRALLSAPEFVLSSLLLAGWSLALVHEAHVIAVLVGWLTLFCLGELFLYLAISEGSQGFLNAVALYLGAVGLLAVALYEWSYAVGLTLVGTSMLMLLDFGRISFARRRQAKIAPGVAGVTAFTTALSGSVAGMSVGLMSALGSESDGRSWMFVPVSSLILALVFGAMMLFLRKSSARGDGAQWTPGETMLPPPSS